MRQQISRIARHELAAAASSVRGAVSTVLILSSAVWAAHVTGNLPQLLPVFIFGGALISALALCAHIAARLMLGPAERDLADAEARLARARRGAR